MADAQYSVAQVIKPFPGFEQVYQGQDTARPIAMPGTLDPASQPNFIAAQAGATYPNPGYSPNLLAGVPVPLGAKVKVQIPLAIAVEAPNVVVVQSYDYTLCFRLRNLRDYRNPQVNNERAAYHFARQSPGAPNSLDVVNPLRVVIPAIQDVIFDVNEATGVVTPRQRVFRVGNTFGGAFGQPFLPGGGPLLGIVQQGVLDPLVAAGLPSAGLPIYCEILYESCPGDDLVIFVRRTDLENPLATWDFADGAADGGFSNVFGTGNGTHKAFRDTGINILYGSGA